MESQDYDLWRYEESHKYDEEIYQDYLYEFKDALEECLKQANKDELHIVDIRNTVLEVFNMVNPDDKINGWV